MKRQMKKVVLIMAVVIMAFAWKVSAYSSCGKKDFAKEQNCRHYVENYRIAKYPTFKSFGAYKGKCKKCGTVIKKTSPKLKMKNTKIKKGKTVCLKVENTLYGQEIRLVETGEQGLLKIRNRESDLLITGKRNGYASITVVISTGCETTIRIRIQ